MFASVRDIDWDTWRPHDVATLLFVIRRGEVLLIRKLRGLGAGKINAPGGRLEPGETPAEADVRRLARWVQETAPADGVYETNAQIGRAHV